MRISGPQALGIAGKLVRPLDALAPRVAALAQLIDDAGDPVDEVVATWFQAPRSFTAEDVVEVSCHGSPIVLRYCVERAIRLGARAALPGEFTLRAYVNGRIDLPQAEAIRDLIESTTLYQAKVAAQQLGGSLSRRVQPVKAQLVELISLLEAGIDFAEDDISVAPAEEILRRLEPITQAVARLESSYTFGRLVQEGFTLALVGEPNVGKSSLFNALLEQDRAIVTEIPGTTRDMVSETASLGGLPMRLLDTAGIRESADRVESLGIERSYQAIADADLVLLVLDASRPMEETERTLWRRVAASGRHLVVYNKADLEGPGKREPEGLRVSARTGEGLDRLRAAVLEQVCPQGFLEAQDGFLTSLRQRDLLRECLGELDRGRQAVAQAIPHEMLLLDLYAALRALDGITGATTADDILNRIFSTFCIGK